MSSIMKGLENESNDFSTTIKNITAQNPKGSAAEKMILNRFLASPMWNDDLRGKDFVNTALEWLQRIKLDLQKKFPDADLSDLEELAHKMYEDYLARIGQLEEEKITEYKKLPYKMGKLDNDFKKIDDMIAKLPDGLDVSRVWYFAKQAFKRLNPEMSYEQQKEEFDKLKYGFHDVYLKTHKEKDLLDKAKDMVGLEENLLNTYGDQLGLPKESAIMKGIQTEEKKVDVSVISINGKPIIKSTDHIEVGKIFDYIKEKHPKANIKLDKKTVSIDEAKKYDLEPSADRDELIRKIWGPVTKKMPGRRYVVHAPDMNVELDIPNRDEAISIAQMIAKKGLNSPASVIDRQTNLPVVQYRGVEDLEIQKAKVHEQQVTAADIKKELDEAHQAIFAILKNIWTKGKREPQNDEEFLGMAERYAKLVLFADADESTKQRAAQSLATDLIPLWHDYHWDKTGFEESQEHLNELRKETISNYLSQQSAAVRGGKQERKKKVPSWKVAAGKLYPDKAMGKYAKVPASGIMQGVSETTSTGTSVGSAGIGGGSGIGVEASPIVKAFQNQVDEHINTPGGMGQSYRKYEVKGPAGLEEDGETATFKLGKPKTHPVKLSNGKFDEVTEYFIYKNKSHVGILSFSKFFGELYGDMGGKSLPTMSIKVDASDPIIANKLFQNFLQSPEGQRRVRYMSDTKMRTKVMPDEEPETESAVMKGLQEVEKDVSKIPTNVEHIANALIATLGSPTNKYSPDQIFDYWKKKLNLKFTLNDLFNWVNDYKKYELEKAIMAAKNKTHE